MKHLVTILLLTGLAAAQCSQGSNGTNCIGPLNVAQNAAAESSIGLTDNSEPLPNPVLGQYWLAISGGTIRESDNNGSYRLPGLPASQILVTTGTYTIGAGVVNTSQFAQVDMTRAGQVRIEVSLSSLALPSGSTAKAQFYNSTWQDLTGTVPVSSGNTLKVSSWANVPSAALGDYPLRVVLYNAGSKNGSLGINSVLVQFR